MEVLLFKNTLFSHFDHLNRTLHYDSCSVWQGHKPFEEESHVEHILYHKNKKGGFQRTVRHRPILFLSVQDVAK